MQRPVGFSYVTGQSVPAAINRHGLEKDFHSFTPMFFIEDNTLEFTTKTKWYPHKGMMEKLHNHNGRIDRNFLTAYVKSFNQRFYLCDPQTFVAELTGILKAEVAKPDNIVLQQCCISILTTQIKHSPHFLNQHQCA